MSLSRLILTSACRRVSVGKSINLAVTVADFGNAT